MNSPTLSLISDITYPLRILGLTLALIHATFITSSQSIKPIVKSLAIEDGLSHNYVYRIYQDNFGGMWIATANGLNYYDGREMTAFTHDPDNENSIVQNDVGDLATSRNGDLWLTMSKGVNRYDRTTETFEFYPMNHPGQSIIPDSSGNVWVGNSNGIQFKAADKDEFVLHPFVTNPLDEGLKTSVVLDIYQGINGDIFFASHHGLYVVNLNSKEERWILPETEYLKQNSKSIYTKSLTGDQYGNLFVGTWDGLFVLFPGDTILQPLLTRDSPQWSWEEVKVETLAFKDSIIYVSLDPQGLYQLELNKLWKDYSLKEIRLPGGLFTDIEIDHSGILWMGTVEFGVQVYDPQVNLIKWIIPSEISGLGVKHNYVNIAREDIGGNLWLGTRNGAFPIMTQPGQNEYVLNNSIGGAELLGNITEITEGEDGNIWFGGYGGIRNLDPTQKRFDAYFDSNPELLGGPQANIVIADLIDDNGNYWTGLWGGGVMLHKNGNFHHYSCMEESILPLHNCYVRDIIEDRQGNIWIAMAYHGLHKLNPVSNSLELFQHSDTDKNSLSHNYVQSLLEDKLGNIWIGTSGGGLNKFDPKTKVFKHFSEKEGLPDNLILDLLQEENGNIWILTNRGITRLDPQLETFQNFDHEDGLPKTRFNSATLGSVSGDILIASNEGVVSFNPAKLDIDRVPPKLAFRSLERYRKNSPDGKAIKVKGISRMEEMEFDHKDNLVSFEFSVLHYRNTKNCQLAYRLDGLHDEWIILGEKRQVTFSGLKRGRYTLLVKAANADGIWNETPLKLPIRVRPPWWKSLVAYVIYFALAMVGLYFMRKYELNRLALQNELKNKELEAEKMKELDQAKSRLFANISHEFRTPLTVIIGQSERIKEPDGIKEIIQRNGRKLLSLINQILDLAKLDSGKLKLSLVHGNIVTFLRYISESLTSLAESKGLELIFYQEVEEIYMDFDEDKIQGVLSNLLSNAIKFTPAGGRVFVHVNHLKEERGDRLILKVKDSGIGIDPNRLPNIFDRFYQVDNSMLRKNEGTGIGLAYVKDLIHLMDGNITVKSKPSQGTEFHISLPIYKNVQRAPDRKLEDDSHPDIPHIQDSAASLVSNHPRGEDSELPLALIVDDNNDVRDYLETCLSDSYIVHSAANGKLGLEKAVEIIPDVIVSDVMMPEMDGFEFCSMVKKDERTSHIPVILLTAKVATSSKIEGFERGADAYLEKPFHKKELLVRLKQQQDLRKQLQKRYGVLEQLPNPKNPKEDAFLQKVQKIIQDNLSDDNFTVMHLCQKIRLSQPQLYRKIKALTGKSTARYMRSYRLFKAKQLLQSSTKNISEVAYEVGFSEPSYFSRSFLEEFGFSPSELRK